MAELAFWLGFAVFAVMLGAVYGSVKRPEKRWYVVGVALVLVGLTFLSSPAVLGKLVVVGGVAVVLASTVPMLRQSMPRS